MTAGERPEASESPGPEENPDVSGPGNDSSPFDPTIVTDMSLGLPDRYEVLSILGSGGMGRVLHAHDRVLDREVAVKLLSEQCAADPGYCQRFLTEARAAASLNDPRIVQIYEYGQSGNVTYLVMEYVDGRSLRRELRDEGRFSERRTLVLAGEACKSLGVAHAAGIVHRDVKPDNLMLTRDGAFKLVDLGLAKRLTDDSSNTITGQSMGTPHYISPEQIVGARIIDRRADVYALGATMFFLATGHTPFEGSTSAHVMARHLNDPLPDPRGLVPDLSAHFGSVVGRAMEKDARDRYQDTTEMLADLMSALTEAREEADHPVSAGHLTMVGKTPSGRAVCPLPSMEFSEEELSSLEKALAGAIGPMARVLVRQESQQADSHENLVHALAAHVNDERERTAFLHQCRGTDIGMSQGPGTGSGTGSGSSLSGSMAPGVAIDDAHLAELTTLLAQRIGPVARVLVKREAKAAAHLTDLAERLAGHIADPAGQSGFLEAAGRLR